MSDTPDDDLPPPFEPYLDDNVPAGGTAGQVLTKVDATDYNTEWRTPT